MTAGLITHAGNHVSAQDLSGVAATGMWVVSHGGLHAQGTQSANDGVDPVPTRASHQTARVRGAGDHPPVRQGDEAPGREPGLHGAARREMNLNTGERSSRGGQQPGTLQQLLRERGGGAGTDASPPDRPHMEAEASAGGPSGHSTGSVPASPQWPQHHASNAHPQQRQCGQEQGAGEGDGTRRGNAIARVSVAPAVRRRAEGQGGAATGGAALPVAPAGATEEQLTALAQAHE